MLTFEDAKSYDIHNYYDDEQLKEYVAAYNAYYYSEGTTLKNNKFNLGRECMPKDILYNDKVSFLNQYETIKLIIGSLRVDGQILVLMKDEYNLMSLDLIIPDKYLQECQDIFMDKIKNYLPREKEYIVKIKMMY